MEYQQLDFMDISESIKNYLRTFSQKKKIGGMEIDQKS